MTEAAVAVYWDFENIHAGALDLHYGPDHYKKNRYRAQEPILDIEAIMDYAATIGTIVVNRAYNNWQSYAQYRNALLVHSIDLVQMFPKGSHSKNGADIRLALDALDDCRSLQHVTDVLIIGGDSDFISLAQKLRQLGRNVIGIGTQQTTNRYWTQSCTEFKFYEAILAADTVQPENEPALEADSTAAPQDLSVAKQLLIRSIKRLSSRSTGGDGVRKAALRPMMVRIDSEFDPVNFGFRTFNQLLSACSDLIEIRRGEYDEMVYLREGSPEEKPENDGPVQGDVHRVVRGAGMCLLEPRKQALLLHRLHALLISCEAAMRRVQIVDALNSDPELRAAFAESELPRSAVSRLVQTISSARCFDVSDPGPPVQLQLGEYARDFVEYRRRHDRTLIFCAARNGVELTAAEWRTLLYETPESAPDLGPVIDEVIAELRAASERAAQPDLAARIYAIEERGSR